ncbi:uncharacterized protein LOC111346652 [Stylophora pistillata]|uniref:uncharacterized protein LOC111346652 n=1 Tax=Stylophora pistillata TaxID=50429 RepID=UPI000C03B416|nr:uncharacterized protein LOC111346652 [Stylophora pistillata]
MAYREKNKDPSSSESSNTSSSETDEDFLSAARSINPELGHKGNKGVQESSNDMAPNGSGQGGSSPLRRVNWPGKPMARKQICMKSDMAVIRRHVMGSSKVTETKHEVKSINKEENFPSPKVMEITQGVQSLKLEDISTCAMRSNEQNIRSQPEDQFYIGLLEATCLLLFTLFLLMVVVYVYIHIWGIWSNL